MNSVVGTFKTRAEADSAAGALRSAGISADRINLLSPGATAKQVQSVPVTDAEAPGIGTALGAAVGGSVGVAGGLLLGDVLATVLLPGIGAVAAMASRQRRFLARWAQWVAGRRVKLLMLRSRMEFLRANCTSMKMRCARADRF